MAYSSAKERAPEEKKELVINVYQERSSMRGIERTFGVSRRTVSAWLKEQANDLPPLEYNLRKTLSFSKWIKMHEIDLKLFIHRYNTEGSR